MSRSSKLSKSVNQSIHLFDEKSSIISLPKIKVIPLPEPIGHHEPFLDGIIRKMSGVSNLEDFDSILRMKMLQKRKQNRFWRFLKLIIEITIISTIVLLTLYSYLFFDPMFNNAIESELNFDQNSRMAIMLQNPSLPYTIKYYLFGLKNAHDFLRGQRPVLVEYGPFVYRVNTKHHSLPLETELTVLNYPLLTALYMVKSMMKENSILGFLSPVVQNVVANVIRSSGEKIIVQRKALDLLDGHRVKFLKNVQRILKPLKALGITFNSELENMDLEHYSYGFGPQNSGQKSELYEHFRHTKSGHLFDGIYKVAGKRKLKDFRPPCNEMNGSSGLYFGMHLTAPEISFFNHNVCRKIRLIKNHTHYHQSLIKVVRYSVDIQLFNSTNKLNRCYCLQSKLSKCQGWIDTSPCLGQLKVGSSFPHFYNSLRRQETVKGLQPDYSKHIGYLDVEPNIGMPINGRIAIQFNMHVSSIPIIGLKSIRSTMLPMFWAEQSNTIQTPMIYWLMIISICFDCGKHFILFIGTFITLIWFYRFFKHL
ncbi:sensory neuron membrane protein 1 isoform X3 [Dermatophagoides farinae]|uniref:sensory neuron membrane protein 1 isoform X3 n=1 Tax=Dermatophagoides farinae TaxID=6954 RepID=UPI003F60E152